MQLIKTKDNSNTFYSEEYKEYFHSLTGAFEEALKKYTLATKLKDREKILDICFGLGYNTFVAVKNFKNLKITALEKNENVLKELQELEIENFDFIKKTAKEHYYKDERCEIRLIVGDATKTIDSVYENFDVVFHDPFSVRVNPELWTEEFFKKVFERMNKGGRLATYSCARVVRDNLKKAGFLVYDIEPVGRRGPSTLALKP